MQGRRKKEENKNGKKELDENKKEEKQKDDLENTFEIKWEEFLRRTSQHAVGPHTQLVLQQLQHLDVDPQQRLRFDQETNRCRSLPVLHQRSWTRSEVKALLLVVLKYGSGETNTWCRGKRDPLFAHALEKRSNAQCSEKWKRIRRRSAQIASIPKTAQQYIKQWQPKHPLSQPQSRNNSSSLLVPSQQSASKEELKVSKTVDIPSDVCHQDQADTNDAYRCNQNDESHQIKAQPNASHKIQLSQHISSDNSFPYKRKQLKFNSFSSASNSIQNPASDSAIQLQSSSELQVHTLPRPLLLTEKHCAFCFQQFSSKSNKLRHTNSCQQYLQYAQQGASSVPSNIILQKFRCSLCGTTFSRTDAARRHIKRDDSPCVDAEIIHL